MAVAMDILKMKIDFRSYDIRNYGIQTNRIQTNDVRTIDIHNSGYESMKTHRQMR